MRVCVCVCVWSKYVSIDKCSSIQNTILCVYVCTCVYMYVCKAWTLSTTGSETGPEIDIKRTKYVSTYRENNAR